MSDTVPRSELTQLHSVIRRECSFQRQSHRRPRNSRRRPQQHDGEENSGGYHWCRWVSSKYRKWEMGKQSGIAILIEHQNKKQQIGVEDAVSVIVVEEFHDHNYTHRETESERTYKLQVSSNTTQQWITWSYFTSVYYYLTETPACLLPRYICNSIFL